jgi:Mrp family chromosome partitioning ATPase
MNRETTQDQILRDFLRLLRRQRVLILAALLIAAGAAVGYTMLKKPVYQASADLQFNDPSQDLSLIGTPVLPAANPPVQAAADATVVTSAPVIRGVSRSLNGGRHSAPRQARQPRSQGNLSRSQIQASVQTSVDPNTNLVTIQTTARTAKLAAHLANSFAVQTKLVATRAERTRLNQAARRLEQSTKGQHQTAATRAVNAARLSSLKSLASLAEPVTIAKPASVPGSPASPQPVRDTLLALFLGLIVGMLAAFMRDSLNRRLTDARDVQRQLQVPMVGYVEADAMGGAGFSQNGSGKSGPDLEPFRILRSNVEFLAAEGSLRTVAITSPLAEEGKSTVAAGLATASALAGKRVLLLECDLRRPVLAERFKLHGQPGLTDWLNGTAQPTDVVQRTNIGQGVGQEQQRAVEVDGAASPGELITLVAGTWSSRPAELLGSGQFREALQEMTKVYDLVVLDCAPLLPVGDALEILPLVDAALICIRLDQTTREQAAAAQAAVEHLPSRPTGVVVTGVRPGREGYYYGYYSSRASHSSLVGSPGSSG